MYKYNEKIQKIYSRKRFGTFKSALKDASSKEKPVKKWNTHNNTKIIKLFVVLLIEILIARSIINIINPVINVKSVSKAKNIATIISNEQAKIIMEKYKYEDLADIVRDESGKIQMIKLNIVPVNQIISEVPVNIQRELNNVNNTDLDFRLGAFTGIKILSGIGPKVSIKVASVGNIETNLKSEFNEAGINQTMHKIFLEVGCEVVILTPFDIVTEKINNHILIAESLIIGEIPSSYYNFSGTNSSDVMRAVD